MEKRRIRLEINGVVCGLITQESEEYMQSLAGEVGEMMQEVLNASPFVTREAAALTAALSYCDDSKKNGRKAFELQERVDELEVEAELWQEEKAEMEKAGPAKADPAGEDPVLRERLRKLEERNTELEESAGRVKELENEKARLEDENAALRQAGHAEEAGDLKRRLEELQRENEDLKDRLEQRAEQEPEEQNGLLAKLEADNQTLRREAEEQAALAQKAEQEKQGAIAAAKRAVEEARRRVDQMEAEHKKALEAAKAQKRQGGSPALDLLEREAADAAGGKKAEEAPERFSRPRRRNPLRYEEDYEQEGFVSFFEKK